MIRNFLLLLTAVIVIAGCDKISHRKTPGGLTYQLYKGKGGKKVQKGNFIKLSIEQKIQDSVYFTTRGKLPIYLPVSTPEPYDISETYTNLRVGDSVVAVQVMDTFLKKYKDDPNFQAKFKPSDRIVTYFKILDAFEHDSLRAKDQMQSEAAVLAGEVTYMQKYLADKNIKAEKTKSGAFVQIINPGTGNLIDSGNYVSVDYTGTSFSGVKFDSNVDPGSASPRPLSFTVGLPDGMIKGFDEAMRSLRKGAVARIFIPSMLAYKDRPRSPQIKPMEHLIFDITIVDVTEKAPEQNPQTGVRPNINQPQPK